MSDEWKPSQFNVEYYSKLKNVHYDSKAELINKFVSVNDKVLDVGCGDGRLMERINGRVFGIDFSSDAIVLCKKKGFDCEQADVLTFTPSELFDVVVCCDVIEHVSYEKHCFFVERLNGFLKKGGVLIMATSPIKDNLLNRFLTWRNDGKVANYDDIFQLSSCELCKLVLTGGFKVNKILFSESYCWFPFVGMVREGNTFLNKLPFISRFFAGEVFVIAEKVGEYHEVEKAYVVGECLVCSLSVLSDSGWVLSEQGVCHNCCYSKIKECEQK